MIGNKYFVLLMIIFFIRNCVKPGNELDNDMSV